MNETWPGRDHVAVIQNRWDDVPPTASVPTVSVIVCHFDQQADLERLVAAMALQRGTADICEVIVVDDGSPEAPVAPARTGSIPVKVLRQPDHGARPAAARNLGTRHSRGEVLVFLDADTVPGPEAVSRLAALPHLTPDAVTVGRRHHVGLDGWTPARTVAWLDGQAPGPPALEDPRWLRDGYARSRDLTEVDDRSYQYVIGAAMAMTRRFFDLLGGFDETIDTYGGEDWDLAYRAYAAGGVLAHCRAAEVFHNGEDWGARTGPRGTKNDERMILVASVPGPTDPLIGPYGTVLVTVEAGGWERAELVAVVADLLRDGGTAVRVAVIDPPPRSAVLFAADSRICVGEHERSRADRALYEVDITEPMLVGNGGLAALTALVAPGGPGQVDLIDDGDVVGRVISTRAAARARRWSHLLSGVTAALAALFGTEERPLPSPVRRLEGPIDLRDWFVR